MTDNELVKALRTYAENAQRNNEFDTMRDFDDAATRIERLARENAELKEAQRWVPVSERLPDDGEIIEAYNDCPIPISVCVFDASEDLEFAFHSVEDKTSWYELVTHWRKPTLPQPPKGE